MPEAAIQLTPESQSILENLAKSGKADLRAVFIPIGEGYRKEVQMIFDHQQPRAEGMRWQALSQKYAAWKEKHFPGMPLLVRTGKLRTSMIQKGSTGNISLIGPISAIFGSSVPYGIYHNSDEQRSSHLPRRNFSEPSERRLNIFKTQIEDHLIHVFEQNGIQVTKGILQ